MRISDWSSDVCSSDLKPPDGRLSAILSLRLNTVEDHDLQVGIIELERCEVQEQSPVGGLQLQSSLVIGHNFGIKRRSLGARKSHTLRETATFEPATVGCIAKYPPGAFAIVDDRDRKSTRLNSSH